MADLVVLGGLLLLLLGAVAGMRRAKKRGKGCGGCPYSGQCGGKCK